MTLCVSLFLRDEEDPKRFAVEAPATDTLVTNEPPSQEVDVVAKPQKVAKKPAKKAVTVHSSRRLQKASDAGATLEAHQSTNSSDDVRKHTVIFASTFTCLCSHPIFWTEPDEEIHRLGQ
jgi:hypothetical protein